MTDLFRLFKVTVCHVKHLLNTMDPYKIITDVSKDYYA